MLLTVNIFLVCSEFATKSVNISLVCSESATKATTQSQINFLTFGGCGQNHIDAGIRLQKQAESTGLFNKSFLYTDNYLHNSGYWTKHSDFIQKNKRGCGYWIWKPYIIKKTMDGMRNGDILLYLDSGCEIDVRKKGILSDYFDIVKKDLIVGTFTGEVEKKWVKMDLIEKLHMKHDEYLDGIQHQAGAIMIFINDITRKIISEWLDVMQDYHLIDDSPSILPNDKIFVEHRHDQSVFSLLTKKYGVYSVETLMKAIEYVRNHSGKSILKN